MKYQLIEEYFETPLFQRTVQEYFDTVLGKIIAENTILSAKGLFVINGEVKRDFYDMPYHIHILNGLIPSLFVYEKFLQEKGWIESPQTELYLKIFILGFTFHDANKLLGTKGTNERHELEIAVLNLDNHVNKWEVSNFLEDFEIHKSTIYHLVLATEDRTEVYAADYAITVDGRDHIKIVQRELCHLADGLASIQNEQLESIEKLYQAVQRSLKKISTIIDLPVSYLKVRQNPYTLLSQELLQKARKTLYKRGKKVLYKTREGIIFWGNDISKNEYDLLKQSYSSSEEEVKYISLTTIDAQKCNFDFIGSIPFTTDILEDIIIERKNDFLKLSTSSKDKIKDFGKFELFLKKLLDTYEAPIDVKINDGRIFLEFWKKLDEDEIEFMKVFNLFKVHWLSASVKEWKKDFNNWKLGKHQLPIYFDIGEIKIKSIEDITNLLSQLVNSKGDVTKLYKVILNVIKTRKYLNDADEIDILINNLLKKTTFSLREDKGTSNVREIIFDRYFECLGNTNITFLENYNPVILEKKSMCVFTGSQKSLVYNDGLAFGVRARGFSNRTITSLNNTTGANGISSLYAEENKVRRSNYPKTVPKRTEKSSSIFVVYNDFFETSLSINQDITNTSLIVKNLAKYVDEATIQLDKNAQFEFNLHNINFVKVSPTVEGFFFFVRRQLLIAQELGLRSYIAGIMTPYQPHKAVFHFENSPRFLKLLGWDDVRLIHLDEVLDEIRLVLTFGKNRIESNLLKIAKNRLAYFSIYYGLNDDDKRKVYSTLVNFYKKYQHKFSSMTITKKLVELAVKIETNFQSSAGETWLIRTAFDFLRTYRKKGYERDNIINKTCGEIYRKKRMDNPSMDDIKNFVTAVYDELFVKEWKEKIPPMNEEKHSIYEFAFLYREKSLEISRMRTAKRILNELQKENKELTEANVKAKLKDTQKKYANQYFETIKNL